MKPVQNKQGSLDEGISDYFEEGQPRDVYQRVTDFLNKIGCECAISDVVENMVEILSHKGILYVTDTPEANKLATYGEVDISEVKSIDQLRSLEQVGKVEIRIANGLPGIGFVSCCADSAIYEGREPGIGVYQREQFKLPKGLNTKRKVVPVSDLSEEELKKVDNRLLGSHEPDDPTKTTGGEYAAKHERQD